MNWADWIIVGILVISSLISLKRGFIKEALSLAVWIAAFLVAMVFSDPLATLLVDIIATPSIRYLTAFIILFISTLVVGGLINYLIGELVKVTGLTGTDRLLGVIFGFARGLVVVTALVLLLPSVVPIDKDPWWQESLLIPHFLALEGQASQLTAEVVDLLDQLFNS